MENDLDRFVELYQNIGLKIHTLSNEVTVKNYFESNYSKSPDKKIDNVKSLDLTKVFGVGVNLGGDANIFALDIDGCLNEVLVNNILKLLGLPQDYEWVVKSGSGVGYHILYSCNNYRVIEEEDNTFGYDSSQSKGPDFGDAIANAYYPAPFCKSFYKVEFKWSGNLVLPPSLHLTGNRYRFLNKFPSKNPKDVSIYDLFKVKEYYTSIYARGSAVSNDFKVRKTDIANKDEVNYSFGDKKIEDQILIASTVQKVEHPDFRSDNIYFLVKLSWMILNQNFNVIKRQSYNYLRREFTEEELIFRENFVWDGMNERKDKHSSIETTKLDESKISLSDRRKIFSELLFDLRHVKKIFALSSDELEYIKKDIKRSGFYLDSFKIPTAKSESLREDIFDEVDYVIDKDVVTYENLNTEIANLTNNDLKYNSEYALYRLFKFHLTSLNEWNQINELTESNVEHINTLGPDNDNSYEDWIESNKTNETSSYPTDLDKPVDNRCPVCHESPCMCSDPF